MFLLKLLSASGLAQIVPEANRDALNVIISLPKATLYFKVKNSVTLQPFEKGLFANHIRQNLALFKDINCQKRLFASLEVGKVFEICTML